MSGPFLNGTEREENANLWLAITGALPHKPSEKCKFWSNDEEILGLDEVEVNIIADLLDCMGYDAITGYYDPEEDAKNGDTDDFTGHYYVTV